MTPEQLVTRIITLADEKSAGYEMKIENAITQHHQDMMSEVEEELENLNTKYAPADLVWFGDEEEEVGEWKYVPAKDPEKAMYCLNCQRFLHEEGCLCGMISVEKALTIIKSK